VTGDRLYDFIIFCINSIPADASYQIVGFTDDSVENRYAVYYLYPHLEKPDPDFILFFDYTGQPEALTSGYDRYASLDKDRYIMKKRGAR
jgi:hypothetical protein